MKSVLSLSRYGSLEGVVSGGGGFGEDFGAYTSQDGIASLQRPASSPMATTTL